MKKMLTLVTTIVIAILIASVSFAGDVKTVNVSATIPTQNTLSVAISKVIGTTFTTASAVNFGNLVLDTTNNLFKTSDNSYYVVDVGINSNASSWTVTHTISAIANGAVNLNNNVNVVFTNQQNSTTGVQLAKLSYASSAGKVINKTDITTGGWLRLTYGLATGSGDATGVVIIPATQAAGTYAGVVTLTLAP
jgi:hypothetical protein